MLRQRGSDDEGPCDRVSAEIRVGVLEVNAAGSVGGCLHATHEARYSSLLYSFPLDETGLAGSI